VNDLITHKFVTILEACGRIFDKFCSCKFVKCSIKSRDIIFPRGPEGLRKWRQRDVFVCRAAVARTFRSSSPWGSSRSGRSFSPVDPHLTQRTLLQGYQLAN